MGTPQKLTSRPHSQSASIAVSLAVAPRDNASLPGMQNDNCSSAEVSTNEQQPVLSEVFLLPSKEDPKRQKKPEAETMAAAAVTTLAGDVTETMISGGPGTPQEESDLTPENHSIESESRSPEDEQVRDSDESGEDSAPEEPLNNSMDEVSILKRLGLFKREFCTEKEVESAFIHLSLAFKSDMFTLKQRLQVEEHARDVAEENVHKELEECKETLKKLEAVCMDGRRQKFLKELEKYLQVLEASITRVTSHAELLGALHQEARVSQGMQVMIRHVENLKCLHAKEHAELQEMRRTIQQNARNRQFGEVRDDADFQNKPQMMRAIHQSTVRRRVSIAVIPKQLMIFHCPDSKVADGEEHRTDFSSSRLSGENRQSSDRSQKRRLEDVTSSKSIRSGEASAPLTDTSECSLEKCNQEENTGFATEDKALKPDVNESESEKGGEEPSPDTASKGSLMLECLPTSTDFTFQRALAFAAVTLISAWLLHLLYSWI
ncbi:inositol 1,4,5-triphosphate receptor associated 2-like isoform X2 [Mobula hypostoma]|uniref:inositol 1,4,5-triphosphate receptor associated 2-like isoform X2 n=1 Tax=Mobula hypostoma TaxID=723540 RepID=UPI002FC31C3E